MPKKSKPKKGRRQPRRRARTISPTQILDLSDEVLLKILQNLGLKQVITPRTIRLTAPAFFLALTCKRLYRIFCEYITDIDLRQSQPFPPPLYHDTHSDAHVSWLLSNLPKLRLLELPECKAHLLESLPRTLRLDTLKYDGDYKVPSHIRFPKTLRVLNMSKPTLGTMECLANLHERPNSCKLRSVFISAVDPAHVNQLRSFYTHSCREIDYFYSSFALSLDRDQREQDNDVVTSCIRFITSNHEQYAPKLATLAFAVTGESRLDMDFDGQDMEDLRSSVVDPYRMENQGRKDLSLLSLWTDAALLESWVRAMSSAITPLVGLSIETGQTCMLYISPLTGFREAAATKYRLSSRISAPTSERNPYMPSLRCEITEGKLLYLCVTERFVVDKFFFTADYRDAALAYLAQPTCIKNVEFYFAFCQRATRLYIWDDTNSANVLNNMSILTADRDETPEEMAFTFAADILSVAKGVEEFSVSFELVSYAPEYELLLTKIFQGLPDATELELIMPNENCNGNPRDGLVNVTELFLIGLPCFLELLKDYCPKLEQFTMVHLGEMTWESDDRQVLLTAEDALDRFERRRPNVYVENVRAMLEFWKS